MTSPIASIASSPEPAPSRFASSPPQSARESSLGLELGESSLQASAPASTAPSSPYNLISDDDDADCEDVKMEEPLGKEDSGSTLGVADLDVDASPERDMRDVIISQFSSEEEAFNKLQFVLDKSALFSSILKQRMDHDKAEQLEALREAKKASKPTRTSSSKKEKKRALGDAGGDEKPAALKRRRMQDGSALDKDGDDTITLDDIPIFPQPALISGAKMKPYQLEGLQWMVALHQNGISGILGDEMGLGKTLQTISFCAYLREQGFDKPFLVVCPLSVMHNWVEEFKKFAPSIPVCMYHGTPTERAELRKTTMSISKLSDDSAATSHTPKKPAEPKDADASDDEGKEISDGEKSEEAHDEAEYENSDDESAPRAKGRSRYGRAVKPAARSEAAPVAKRARGGRGRGTTGRTTGRSQPKAKDSATAKTIQTKLSFKPSAKAAKASGDAAEAKEDVQEGSTSKDASSSALDFPVVVTTYEMIIRDRVHLAPYEWGYIVVDEGHRLKNLECKLIKEIKKYSSAGRMILTGTPLHNNLAELWSLLNFVLPDIFTDVEQFQEWFNLPDMQSNIGSERASSIIESLHAILKPFLLRRLKVDVEFGLPPKKEYVLYAPLTAWQHEVYGKVLDGALRGYLLSKSGSAAAKEAGSSKTIDVDGPRRLRSTNGKGKKKGRKNYVVDGDDDEYFEMLERGELDERGFRAVEEETDSAALAELARQHQYKAAAKKVNNMKLQNTVMQLRKVCSHPFLFDWPIDPRTRQPMLDDRLVNSSGKMLVLDRLLTELFKRKHKVLLFSQFTTMLDVIEDWAIEFKGWELCRIDGSTSPMERRDQMNRFQNGGDAPDAPCLFLLSTRAGGLGINLTAADTVIFYDQDWNPQMDAQAQDRAHRIGQTKPVLIFRLVSAHTIETKIMQRASEKRKLEALVIAKGKFKKPATAARAGKPATMAEMAAELLKLEGEKIEVVPDTEAGKASVLSDAELDMLLDRSPEVFADRQRGWTSAQGNTDKTTQSLDRDGDAAVPDRDGGSKTAFAVYEAPPDEGSEALAMMMGEEVV
ncbi:hypothetical protein HGRIS_010840 [Hohenbuehelia grisea]|uniref:Uncharacterized protein n=1 Tax=Hohenbuehelia grisea TaxID=104357 RepID=A0ABR3IYA9_9AGAR